MQLQHSEFHLIGERSISGYLINSGAIGRIICVMRDFKYECRVFIPLEKIIDISHDKFDVFFHQRILELGRVPDLLPIPPYRLESYETFFTDIETFHTQQGKSLIFEGEPHTDIFECGKFLSYNCEFRTLVIKPYDQRGRWLDKKGIDLDEIEAIKLDDDYTQVFDQYLLKREERK